jgi:hypothetical protein
MPPSTEAWKAGAPSARQTRPNDTTRERERERERRERRVCVCVCVRERERERERESVELVEDEPLDARGLVRRAEV